jgi:hypothetical protein
MTPRSRILLSFVAALHFGCADEVPELGDVLARHAEARGGAAALEAIESLEIELTLTEGDFEATILYRAVRPGRARVDVRVDGERVFTEAFDGSAAWQLPAGAEGPAEASPEGTAALHRGAIGNLYGLHERPGLGQQLELLDTMELDGIRHMPIRITHDDGFVTQVFLDAETFLVTRSRSVNALHPDADPTERRLESRHSDFREVDGVRWAFESGEWDLDTGEQLQRVTIRRIVINPPLDPTIFDLPLEGLF